MLQSLVSKRGLLAQALGAAFLLHSSGASALGLMQAYEAALKNDPVYRAAFYSNEAGKENRILGRSNLLPSLSGSYSGSKNRSDIKNGALPETHPEYNSKSAVVQLRQTLVNFDALARYKQGGLQADYSASIYMSEQQQVALRVVGAYVEVLFKQDQLAVAKFERDAYVERMKVNDRMFSKGEGTRTDMLETRARLDVAEAALLEAQDNLAATRATLAGVIGGDPGELDRLTPQFSQRPLGTQSFDAWKRLAMERSHEIRTRQLAVEIGRQEVNKAKAGHYPRLDFVASYSKNTSESINTINQDSTTRSVGLQLNVPLYAGGSVNASTRQAVANREKAAAELQAEIDKSMVELRKDYDQLISSVSRIEALGKAVDSGKLLVTATEQSIKGGVRINLDLLDAQRQLSATERDLAQARYSYILAYLKLRAAAGTLEAQDLREMAAYFR
ncbi:TolC family outer membrane protein [Pseudoduganella namucuonensis]|uniref:Outer membrane protein, protease secretion system n=1 Tax=Pseudoduganella namucuonensis TaxID=1035707 RepID=A0A1I7FRV3_9BURK|nr:TolC family outer membrane protein [Pseudoduganella namucuonensis]SFU38910.1 outer membrane protein, protease secretion system [Pseudoduganella namucuonensis]